MSQVAERVACEGCQAAGGDTSGNNLVVYTDGGKHCFACGLHVSKGGESVLPETPGLLAGEFPEILRGRGITKDVLKFFNYQTGYYTGKFNDDYVENEAVHIANIANQKGRTVAQQLRASNKRFKFLGNTQGLGLVGTHLWEPNPQVFVTVVEGYIDQLSVAQAQGTRFPVLTVPMGAQSAPEAFKKSMEYLVKWKHVVIAFDNDDAGIKAAEECAKLLPPGKARIATWPLKDANDSLVAQKYQDITDTLFNARTVKPEGVISIADIPLNDFKQMYTTGTDLPFPILNKKLNGLQSGALYTFVAQEKAGKSLLTKEIVLYFLEQGKKIGLLYLEEGAPEAASSLVAMDSFVPAWKLRNNETLLNGPEGIKMSLEKYRDQCYIYHHKGVIDMEGVHTAMQYMTIALGCEFIVLDNTSLVVAGTDANMNERKMIDNFVHKVVAMCNGTKATVLNVCHVTKNRPKDEDGNESSIITKSDIFGSGAFGKFSYSVVALERNFETDTTYLKVLADRGPGGTGYADKLKYNAATGRLMPDNSEGVLE